MHSCLLKKLLPFTLTFVVGAGVGGLFKVNRARTTMWTWSERATPLLGHEGPFGYERHRSCRMYRRDLVAETRLLDIHFIPDAVLPRGLNTREESVNDARALVTFGADGEVHEVKILNSWQFAPHEFEEFTKLNAEKNGIWAAVAERAARNIEFTPETINSVPVSVTKEVEIRFIDERSNLRLPLGTNRERSQARLYR